MKPSSNKLKFSFSFTDGSSYQTAIPITIRSANFKKEHIKLKPKKYKISQDKPSRNNENRLIGKKSLIPFHHPKHFQANFFGQSMDESHPILAPNGSITTPQAGPILGPIFQPSWTPPSKPANRALLF